MSALFKWNDPKSCEVIPAASQILSCLAAGSSVDRLLLADLNAKVFVVTNFAII